MKREIMDGRLDVVLRAHAAWIEAAARAGETEGYIEQQAEAAWPFRGNGPESANARLSEQNAKADALHSVFLRERAWMLGAMASIGQVQQ